ncbi:MAG: indole-3-glycerol phosphate synthase [Elusimicrobia bacterium]|nr:MAG: indole-3-glycerol phosphate synthase [Elusimicrobiota bacterium]
MGAIADSVRRRLPAEKKSGPVTTLRRSPLYARRPLDFGAALGAPGARVIAEVKFASPSEGLLRERPSAGAAVAVAGSYLAAGAAALSVLTEPEFFRGSRGYLRAIRQKYPAAPLLMKDFFVDRYQFEQARACGADAVLLIAALLGDALADMLRGAESLGLSALVEVHTEAELKAAGRARARLIGVNSRDLKTLKTDLGVARALGPAAKGTGAVLVAESGIRTAGDIASLWACGYDVFLIGTELMRQADPGAGLKALLSHPRYPRKSRRPDSRG